MKDWDELHADGDMELYFCECADIECREKVSLGRSDYRRVRADSRHFVVMTGHAVPDVETVIDVHDGWAVVEKASNVTSLVEGLDSRAKPGDDADA